MIAEWYKVYYWTVETTYGTEIVPCDVEHDPSKLGMYVEGTIAMLPERVLGWVGRMTATGYLDSTEWIACDTEAEIKAELASLYDLDPDTMTESPE